MLWRYLGNSHSPTNDKRRFITTLLNFLDRMITASIDRRRPQLVDALIVISKTKVFADQVVDSNCLSAFDKFGWEEFETSLFGSAASRETRFEIVVSFLTNVVENVPEVFHGFQPFIDSLVEATKLSQTGNFPSYTSYLEKIARLYVICSVLFNQKVMLIS
jgi:hypothetical protein